MTIKRIIGAAAIALVMSFSALPAASAAGGDRQTPEELAREGLSRMLEKLEQLGRRIPLYGLPELRDNGDIIIPRWRPGPDAEKPPAEDKDGAMPELEEIEA